LSFATFLCSMSGQSIDAEEWSVYLRASLAMLQLWSHSLNKTFFFIHSRSNAQRLCKAWIVEPKQWRCGCRIWRYGLQEAEARWSSYRPLGCSRTFKERGDSWAARWESDYEGEEEKTCCVCVSIHATATRQLDSGLFRHNASEQMEKCSRRSNVDQPKEYRAVCAGPIGGIPQVHVRPYRMTSKKQYEARVVEMQSQRYRLLQLVAAQNRHGTVG
jgi:hypothetical protein